MVVAVAAYSCCGPWATSSSYQRQQKAVGKVLAYNTIALLLSSETSCRQLYEVSYEQLHKPPSQKMTGIYVPSTASGVLSDETQQSVAGVSDDVPTFKNGHSTQ